MEMKVKRILKATTFISLHALIAIVLVFYIAPSWVVACGIIGAALATLLLITFASDEQWAKLFFAENWQELEDTGSPAVGFLFTLVGCIWAIPVLCFFITLGILLTRKLVGYN